VTLPSPTLTLPTIPIKYLDHWRIVYADKLVSTEWVCVDGVSFELDSEKRHFAEGGFAFLKNYIFPDADYLILGVVKIKPENI